MSKLLIVESPSKAKTIGKYLGSDFVVRASVGHVRDLPKSSKNAIDIKNGFKPNYQIVPGKEAIVNELATAAKKATEVLLATDPDREGEAIAWHIEQLLKERVNKTYKRVVFHEITKKAVEEALTHPRDIDQNLVEAQEARRVLDRIVGYDLSGLIWKKLRYGLSAGRVQSPALRILVEREREIRAHKPEPFWIISANLKTEKDEEFVVECSEVPTEETRANSIAETAQSKNWKTISVSEEEAKRSPKAPFTTSTLQQAASSRLGLSPGITMRLAQKLYEQGLITYMRTDSNTLSTDSMSAIESLVKEKFGAEFSSPRVHPTKSKNAQEAHEAIRPTDATVLRAGASASEQKLYNLIWARTVASQMADAKLARTKIEALPVDAKKDTPIFSATGSRITFKGWLSADPDAASDDVIMPKVSENDPLSLVSSTSTRKETEPPHRYSEAGLIKELEKRGIGRPSTYASIIETLVSRKYVDKENRSLIPTETGEVVSEFLEKNFERIIGDDFTAEMEEDLDAIARGEKKYEKILSAFYGPFEKEIKEKEKLPKMSDLGPAPLEIKCPTCNSQMIIKLSRSGKFYSCEKFPECTGARTIDGAEIEKPKSTGKICPKCGKGELIERTGKFGAFIGCDKYPKCKFIEKDESKPTFGDTGIACPNKDGTMVEKRGRFGSFYSCSNYPDCKFNMKSKPTGRNCTICGKLMMEGTKTIPERCSDKLCPNHNPHKLA